MRVCSGSRWSEPLRQVYGCCAQNFGSTAEDFGAVYLGSGIHEGRPFIKVGKALLVSGAGGCRAWGSGARRPRVTYSSITCMCPGTLVKARYTRHGPAHAGYRTGVVCTQLHAAAWAPFARDAELAGKRALNKAARKCSSLAVITDELVFWKSTPTHSELEMLREAVQEEINDDTL